MGYQNLRDFIRVLEKKDLLKRISTEVNCELEITEIVDRMCKCGGPALYFEKVKGYDCPVLINAFGSYERMRLALEIKDFTEVARRIEELLSPRLPGTFLEKIEFLPKLMGFSQIVPRLVKSAPCQEVVIDKSPSLDKFPILKCWPKDGGRFITLPLVITGDPDTGSRNVGMYRMQVFDGTTCGMHWHVHKHGAMHYEKYEKLNKRMEAVVALGGDPATIYAATCPLPEGVDEFLFAGFLRKEGIELVKAKTVNLEVPAQAEIVLEGYIDPKERKREGPFGDHTGFYSPVDDYPVFHITCITHRRDAIYPATVVGKPPMEDCYMAKATERIFLPVLKFQLPEIIDINLPIEGVFHNCAIISIKKSFPGQGRKVIHACWGLGQLSLTKVIIVVEEDVDVQNLSEVAWKVFNNIDPKRDLVFSEGPIDVLDHSANFPLYGSKLGIDATRKGKEEGMQRPWPDEIKMPDEIKTLVDKRWKEYGF